MSDSPKEGVETNALTEGGLATQLVNEGLIFDEDSCTYGLEFLAAAIVQLRYEQCFAVLPSELGALATLAREKFTPDEVALLLGKSISGPSVPSKADLFSLAPSIVLYCCVLDSSTDLRQVIQDGLALVKTTWRRLQWRVSSTPRLDMLIVRSSVTGQPPSNDLVSKSLRLAYAERNASMRTAGDAKDPTLNGRPEEALQVPRPILMNSFAWWCLQLGFMLKSPYADTPNHTEVIDQIGDHCLRLLPQAHRETDEERASGSASPGGYATCWNEALPKYARMLIKRGLYERAIEVCQSSIRHAIEPSSPGAFERALASAEKKLTKSQSKSICR